MAEQRGDNEKGNNSDIGKHANRCGIFISFNYSSNSFRQYDVIQFDGVLELSKFAFNKSYFEILKKYKHDDVNNSYSQYFVEDELHLSYVVSKIKTGIMQELIFPISTDMVDVTNSEFHTIIAKPQDRCNAFVKEI